MPHTSTKRPAYNRVYQPGQRLNGFELIEPDGLCWIVRCLACKREARMQPGSIIKRKNDRCTQCLLEPPLWKVTLCGRCVTKVEDTVDPRTLLKYDFTCADCRRVAEAVFGKESGIRNQDSGRAAS